MRKGEAGVENVLSQPQDRTGNSGGGGAFLFNPSVAERPKIAALENC